MDNDTTPYPLTIIKDRYGGSYTKGEYLAFNAKHFHIPKEVQGDDMTQVDWIHDTKMIYGVGDTPEGAIEDLKRRLSQ